MNSFIENVNYVAGLDNRYGSGIELYKNNLSLKSVQHDIELKFSYYILLYICNTNVTFILNF